MQVKLSAVRALFVACGFETAVDWTVTRASTRVEKIRSSRKKEDFTEPKDPEQLKLLEALCEAVKEEKDIKIEDDTKTDEELTKESDKKKAGSKKEKAEKPAKEKKEKAPKKEKEPKKPGVIDTILASLKAASKDSPLTKKDIVKKLVKAFPARAEDSMAKTVNVQVPTRLGTDREVKVKTVDLGEGKGKAYYV